MINEFSERKFDCAQYIPSGQPYQQAPMSSKICAVIGAVAGQDHIQGDAYINTSFEYYKEHLWRNYGIIVGFLLLFLFANVICSEVIRAKPSKGEILVFLRGKFPFTKRTHWTDDLEVAPTGERQSLDNSSEDHTAQLAKQTAIFHWQDVCYNIKIKGENRRILDHVDGWVKPGTLTALMGVTGAG